MALITFEQAKQHLQLDHDSDDAWITENAEVASGLLLDYLKKPVDYWQATDGTPEAVPPTVVAACKLVLGALYENREGDARDPAPLSQAVRDLVHRWRDPAMA